jgi:threonine dehydrogenase-like Zn-dependent dehydrogenase
MRALYLDGKLTFRSDLPAPSTGPDESRVRVTTAGICGTDIELTRGYMAYRGIPGHEFVGVVEKSSQPELVGRRVVGEINAACGHCEWCVRDLSRHCPSRTVLGIVGRSGAFADYLVLPDRNLLPVPDNLPDNIAVMCEPVAAAYEIFEQTHLAPDEEVVVLGDGRLGAIVGLTMIAEGLEPIVAGRHPEKLDRLRALKLNVELENNLAPHSFDVVVDATGRPAGFNRAIELVRPRGRIILKSTAAGMVPLNLAPAVVNEITIIGSRCGRFAPALKALAEGRLRPLPLVTATFPIEKGIEAIQAASDSANLKVLLTMA